MTHDLFLSEAVQLSRPDLIGDPSDMTLLRPTSVESYALPLHLIQSNVSPAPLRTWSPIHLIRDTIQHRGLLRHLCSAYDCRPLHMTVQMKVAARKATSRLPRPA